MSHQHKLFERALNIFSWLFSHDNGEKGCIKNSTTVKMMYMHVMMSEQQQKWELMFWMSFRRVLVGWSSSHDDDDDDDDDDDRNSDHLCWWSHWI